MAFKISQLVISLLVFSAVIAGMSIFYADLNQNYGKDEMTDLQSMSVSQEILQKGKEAEEALKKDIFKELPIAGEIINFFYKGTVAVWSAMSIMASSINLAQNIVSEAATILPMPGWFISISLAIIIIVIVFAFASAILRHDV